MTPANQKDQQDRLVEILGRARELASDGDAAGAIESLCKDFIEMIKDEQHEG